MTLATLGPKGTFSEQAALKYKEKEGLKEDIIFCNTIKEIFDFVENENKGVVPVENMLDGSVGKTLDLLYNNDVYIIDEIIIPIHLCIAAESEDFDTLISHPKALGQCLNYIRGNNLETKEATSTAKAMQTAKGNIAAVGTKLAAKEYGLKIIKENVEDKENNVTRFFVLSKKKGKGNKTSIAIHPKEDRPGLLYDLLKEFAEKNINLTKIESRPTKATLGDYIFYIDFEGSIKDDNVVNALKEIKKIADVKFFGSYPKGY